MFFSLWISLPYGPDLRLCSQCSDFEQRALLEFPSLPGLVVLPLTWPRVDYLVADVRMSDTVIVFFSSCPFASHIRQFSFFLFKKLHYLCRGTCTCESACVGVIGQLVKVGFLLTVWVLGIELR